MLDRKGLHRVHAMGLTYGLNGILCLLPQGGGKTTLCLALLRREGISLLSDDTPLIDRCGRLFPFPVRIGVCEVPANIPEQYLSKFNRRKYGAKTVIDIELFKNKIASPSKASIVLVGDRKYSNDAAISPLGKLSALSVFMVNCVAGLGLPQMVEYFLRYRLCDNIGKMGIALSRTWASIILIMKARTYRFTIGSDKDRNTEVLSEFLTKYSQKTDE
jgi:hypothetical protein